MPWRWWAVRGTLGLGAGLGGCGGEQDSVPSIERAWVALVAADAWVEVTDPLADPFQDRPPTVDCSSLGYGVEATYFEVETDDCAYGTFQQPSLHSVAAGEELELVFWHLDLWAPDPAQAHVAVATRERLLFEAWMDIPSSSEVRAETFSAPQAIEKGDPIFFHVHNHGYNSWSLGGLEAYTLP